MIQKHREDIESHDTLANGGYYEKKMAELAA
jgi:hypothetical protein